MKTYEVAYVISPEMTSEEAESKAKELESAIQSREGIILKQSNPVARTLAYPIANRASGFFGFLEFQLEPEKLLEFKDIIAKDEKIVRHMLIVKEPIKHRKERRTRIKPTAALETEQTSPEPEKISDDSKPREDLPAEAEKETPAKTFVKEKVELKDIEQELDELLGE
jgi:ribosomal protein S6